MHLYIFCDRGPARNCHFSVTLNGKFLAYLHNYWPMYFWYFLWKQTSEVLAFFLDCRTASFWHFSMTADLRIFYHFSWPWTSKFLAYLHNCWPMHYSYFSVIADQGGFSILPWPQNCKFWHFFVTCEFWHFFVTCEFLAFFCDGGPTSDCGPMSFSIFA